MQQIEGWWWEYILCLFCFVFQAPSGTDPVVQWSVQWPNGITILNRAGVQWFCRATPEGGYTSTTKSLRNRTWPPGNAPRPTGHLSGRLCLVSFQCYPSLLFWTSFEGFRGGTIQIGLENEDIGGWVAKVIKMF